MAKKRSSTVLVNGQKIGIGSAKRIIQEDILPASHDHFISLSGIGLTVAKSHVSVYFGVQVATINVTPSMALVVGTDQSISASALDPQGNPVAGRIISATSLNTSVCTIQGTSGTSASFNITLHPVAAGSAQIRVICDGVIGFCNVSVTVVSSGAGILLFRDVFTGGVKSGDQNGVHWGAINIGGGGTAGSVYVTPDAGNSSGYALAIQYNGSSTTPGADLWVEPRFTLPANPGLPRIYVEMRILSPANIQHYRPLPNNNKLLRLWDNSYQDSWIHSGMSTIAPSGTGYQAASQLIGEYEWTGTGGGMGTHNMGPYLNVFEPLREVVIGFCMYAESAPNTLDGRIRVWIDNVKRSDRSGIQTCITTNQVAQPTGAYLYRNGHVFGWANTGYPDTTIFLLREFKVYTDVPTGVPA